MNKVEKVVERYVKILFKSMRIKIVEKLKIVSFPYKSTEFSLVFPKKSTRFCTLKNANLYLRN